MGHSADQDDPLLSSIISELKEKENQGYKYEAAEASFELLMRKALGLQRNFFRIDGFRVMNNKYRMDRSPAHGSNNQALCRRK